MSEHVAVEKLLDACVTSLGGQPRAGQQAMAAAVSESIATGYHLAVQAGTGTGKSLAYIVPAIQHSVNTGMAVVVSTATIALQRQLVDRDLPRFVSTLSGPLGTTPTFALLKGRSNYLCKHKLTSGPADDDQTAILDDFSSSRTSREIRRLHTWAETTQNGDREELDPGVSEAAWRQVSVGIRECIGAAQCPYGQECFAELARRQAGAADIVVTNHALLAIDAAGNNAVLPDHDVVIVDEAHELVDRVTSVSTAELSSGAIAIAARRAGKLIDEVTADDMLSAAEHWTAAAAISRVGRWERLSDEATEALTHVRDSAWAAHLAIGGSRAGADATALAARQSALTAIDAVHDAAVRALEAFPSANPAERPEVVWLTETTNQGRVLYSAPLSVGGILRSTLFANSTVILTSATMTVGGTFTALAREWGLPASSVPHSPTAVALSKDAPADTEAGSGKWTELDVGSPFTPERSGILYVAKHLPPPGRDGPSEKMLAELQQLIEAADGRTLGLFSSIRAAKVAAEELRRRWDGPLLCQGDDATGHLVRRFAADPRTVLFGTLSLWQGVDVPGPSLSCVVIDRIPFPRPDDPLLDARSRAVDARGGSGFLDVSVRHAGLLLAQGAGRLLRSTEDKGVVAVFDSRLATARYGGILVRSLPPFYRTTDPEVALGALRRLRAQSPD